MPSSGRIGTSTAPLVRTLGHVMPIRSLVGDNRKEYAELVKGLDA